MFGQKPPKHYFKCSLCWSFQSVALAISVTIPEAGLSSPKILWLSHLFDVSFYEQRCCVVYLLFPF